MSSIEEIIQKITFHPVKPNTPCQTTTFVYQGLKIPFDALNTQFGKNSQKVLDIFQPILNIPRMSTLANAYLINQLVAQIPADQCYLNIGVWQGFSFLAGILNNPEKHCIGVDNFSMFKGPKKEFMTHYTPFHSTYTQFFEMDYEEYMQHHHTMPIGFYFFDGPHEYEHQYKALVLAEPFLHPGSYIMIDDTNWPQPRKATMSFIQERPEQYRVVLDTKTANNGHPTYWNGIILLQRL